MTDGLSGRYHSTFGRGFPLTLQHKLTFVPRLRITSFGGLLVNLGGSRGKISDCHIKIRLDECFRYEVMISRNSYPKKA